MKIMIRIEDELLEAARRRASESGRTLDAVIEDALRQALAERDVVRNRPRVRIPTMGGKGVLPGVDLDDSASLLDLMESVGSYRR